MGEIQGRAMEPWMKLYLVRYQTHLGHFQFIFECWSKEAAIATMAYTAPHV
jgi:hypothetical protein